MWTLRCRGKWAFVLEWLNFPFLLTIFRWCSLIATIGSIPPYTSWLQAFILLVSHFMGLEETCLRSCFRTTLDRILRSEVTTAAQVSSAEDSRASTLKCRWVYLCRFKLVKASFWVLCRASNIEILTFLSPSMEKERSTRRSLLFLGDGFLSCSFPP